MGVEKQVEPTFAYLFREGALKKIQFAMSALCVALSACTSVPEVPVARQWAATINNFSLQAIYPMREDVRVGDIKLTVDATTAARGVLPFRDIARLDLSDDMRKYYEMRPSYPVDQSFATGRDPSKPWAQPTGNTPIFDPNTTDVNRLRMAALPGIKVATVAQGTLGGDIPLEGFSLGGAVSAQGNRLLDISLTGIEELKAPDDFTIFSRFKQACASEIQDQLADDQLRNSLALMTAELVEKARPQLAIVNQVYYARAVDYTFKTDKGYAVDLAATVGALGELAKLSTALGGKGTVPPPTASGAPAPADPAAATAKEIADLVAAMRAKVTGATAPGLSFSTVFVDARGVTLRDVFQVPLAFGAQVVTLDYVPGQNICTAGAAAPGANRMYSIGDMQQ